MKKRIWICAGAAAALLCCIVILLVSSNGIVGEEGLIEKARREINLADADTIDMVIAGKSMIDGDTHLFWFITGNEYQMNSCHPLEFTELENGNYKFVKKYNPIPRGQDIYALQWRGGYSFIVYNPDCAGIRICGYDGETNVSVDEIPFVYHYPLLPGAYSFYDKDGNEIY